MEGDKQVPTGTVGEVWIRGPNVMRGYWHDQGKELANFGHVPSLRFHHSAATNKVLTKDGWLKSGDLGYLDKEGFLYVRGRSKVFPVRSSQLLKPRSVKDIIIRGGENIVSQTPSLLISVIKIGLGFCVSRKCSLF